MKVRLKKKFDSCSRVTPPFMPCKKGFKINNMMEGKIAGLAE